MIEAYGLTDTGCVRSANQDRILLDSELGLFVVADGMGGHSHGERAAELAISTIRYYIDSSRDRFDVTWPFGYNFDLSLDANRIATAIQLANRHVWRQAEQAPEYSGMGTTVAAILVSDDRGTVGNVGDSRVYLFRGGDLQQITKDDTWVSAALERGNISESDLSGHPMRNVLTQAAGSQEMVEVHTFELELQHGDIVLICSDGLHGVIGDAAVRSILGSGEGLEPMTTRLIGAARSSGGPDNISSLVVRFRSGTGEPVWR